MALSFFLRATLLVALAFVTCADPYAEWGEPELPHEVTDEHRELVQQIELENPNIHVPGDKPAKHDPFIKFLHRQHGPNGGDEFVTVQVRGPGEELHPQTQEHHINLIYVRNQNGKLIYVKNHEAHDEGEPLVARFMLDRQSVEITPYSFCNKHGLFKGRTYNVRNEQVMVHWMELAKSKPSKAGPMSVHPLKKPWPPTKHVPFIYSLHPSKRYKTLEARIGVAGPGKWDQDNISYHPHTMEHHIRSIFLKDEHGVIIARDSEPHHSDLWLLHIPEGINTVTPYSLCNEHGLWEGNKYTVRGEGAWEGLEPKEDIPTHAQEL